MGVEESMTKKQIFTEAQITASREAESFKLKEMLMWDAANKETEQERVARIAKKESMTTPFRSTPVAAEFEKLVTALLDSRAIPKMDHDIAGVSIGDLLVVFQANGLIEVGRKDQSGALVVFRITSSGAYQLSVDAELVAWALDTLRQNLVLDLMADIKRPARCRDR